MYIFTDGGCTKNGKKNAKASFGVYINNMVYTGYVMPYEYKLSKTDMSIDRNITCTNTKYILPSNNRGELLGIIYGLLYLINNYKISIEYTLYSDSLISINTINKWYNNREKKNTLHMFKNIDLVTIMMILYRHCKTLGINITCKHILAHTKYSATLTEIEKKLWYGNYIVDSIIKILLNHNISNDNDIKPYQHLLLICEPPLPIHQVHLVTSHCSDT